MRWGRLAGPSHILILLGHPGPGQTWSFLLLLMQHQWSRLIFIGNMAIAKTSKILTVFSFSFFFFSFCSCIIQEPNKLWLLLTSNLAFTTISRILTNYECFSLIILFLLKHQGFWQIMITSNFLCPYFATTSRALTKCDCLSLVIWFLLQCQGSWRHMIFLLL